MSRTNSTAVQEVLGRDYDASPEVGDPPSLTPYIDTAASIVDDLVDYCDDNEITEPSAAKLELIERWLSAHSYCLSDKAFTSKSTAGASASFNGQTGKGLTATLYGQQAVALDPTGYLQSLAAEAETNGSRRAGMFWGGTSAPDALTWDERN